MVQTGTIVFDACIFEIFGCLLHGFSLHILKKEFLLDTFSFADFLEKQNSVTSGKKAAPAFRIANMDTTTSRDLCK